jgi:penicillin amidase
MRKLVIKTLAFFAVLCIAIIGLSRRISALPPLGRVLNPYTGIVQNERAAFSRELTVRLPRKELTDSVRIMLDARDVPHIFASNVRDLYFAQGFMAAYFRLWQMDFISRVAAGRSAEVFGESRLSQDRLQRRMGVAAAAEASLRLMQRNAETGAALEAYTAGVNAYIAQLNDADLPLEYKCLDYRPEAWTALKSALVMKYVTAMLSGFEDDDKMTRMMLALGEQAFNQLFPEFPSHFTPVAGDPVANPGNHRPLLSKPVYLDSSFLPAGPAAAVNPYNPNLGSNSWAVSGKKTNTGHPILCNDPHLGLTLPAIWLEVQLSGPGEDVYGVSIPGIPAVIIGFNDRIAWGTTNGEDDVKDWYKLRYSPDHRRYQFDGQWLDLDRSVERIGVRGKGIFTDTVWRSLQGPIVFDDHWKEGEAGHAGEALSWGISAPSDEMLAFIQLNRAKNYSDYLAAIRHYSCPVQNFTFADRNDTIAINHEGKMAVKWPGQGKFILDGSRPTDLYRTTIPKDSLPHLVNPACGYVLSANQHPTSPGYPYYYNGRYMEDRANRIKQLLDSGGVFDIERMKKIQLDDISAFAVEALPLLIRRVDDQAISDRERTILESLSKWDGSYGLDEPNAILYEYWWNKVRSLTWDEPIFSGAGRQPDDRVLLDLIRDDPSSHYFRRWGTDQHDSADGIVRLAFQQAVAESDSVKTKGVTTWGDGHRVYINHLLGIGAFGRRNVRSAGHPDVINAVSDVWGPSWRMIVELGDRPRAFGIYPGGQSGNPGSPHYDDFVDDWLSGRYFELNFYTSVTEARSGTQKEISLIPTSK